MSLAPYFLKKGRGGYRMGHGEIFDMMVFDGLQDPYSGRLMGEIGEASVARNGLSREEQDEFAIRSYRLAQAAITGEVFSDETVPVVKKGKGMPLLISWTGPATVSGTRNSVTADGDVQLHYTNEDGVINVIDAQLKSRLAIWRQELPTDPFVRLGSVNSEDLEEIEADILGFTLLALVALVVALIALAVAYVALGFFLGSRIGHGPSLLSFGDATGTFKRWREALRMGERGGGLQ